MPFEVLEMADCLEFWLLSVKKYLKMPKIRVSEGLKSKYLQLWAEYSITTPETPYRLSINGLLTSIGHLRCSRLNISEYSAHNCRYFFRPSETLILSIFGKLFTLRTQNLRNGTSPTSQMAYSCSKTIYTESIWSFRGSNWIFCSQLQIFWF